MKYTVYVEKVQIAPTEIEADSADEAIKLALKGEGRVCGDVFFVELENSQHWTVWDEEGNEINHS